MVSVSSLFVLANIYLINHVIFLYFILNITYFDKYPKNEFDRFLNNKIIWLLIFLKISNKISEH